MRQEHFSTGGQTCLATKTPTARSIWRSLTHSGGSVDRSRPFRMPRSASSILDLVRYTAEGGAEFLLAVVGVDESNNQRVAVVRLTDWDGASPLSASSGPPDLRLMANVQPFALMPYRGADLPTKPSELVMRKWPVPAAQRQDHMVGCSIVSWGVNLDWQLRSDRQHH